MSENQSDFKDQVVELFRNYEPCERRAIDKLFSQLLEHYYQAQGLDLIYGNTNLTKDVLMGIEEGIPLICLNSVRNSHGRPSFLWQKLKELNGISQKEILQALDNGIEKYIEKTIYQMELVLKDILEERLKNTGENRSEVFKGFDKINRIFAAIDTCLELIYPLAQRVIPELNTVKTYLLHFGAVPGSVHAQFTNLRVSFKQLTQDQQDHLISLIGGSMAQRHLYAQRRKSVQDAIIKGLNANS